MFKMKISKTYIFFLILCVFQIYYIFHFRSGFEFKVFKNPFNINSGVTSALPPEVIELRHFLRKNNHKDFNLSKVFKDDIHLYQRAIEFSYPIRINKDSKNTFFLISEDIPDFCEEKEIGDYIKYTNCSYDS